jgi:hypothetical protein
VARASGVGAAVDEALKPAADAQLEALMRDQVRGGEARSLTNRGCCLMGGRSFTCYHTSGATPKAGRDAGTGLLSSSCIAALMLFMLFAVPTPAVSATADGPSHCQHPYVWGSHLLNFSRSQQQRRRRRQRCSTPCPDSGGCC